MLLTPIPSAGSNNGAWNFNFEPAPSPFSPPGLSRPEPPPLTPGSRAISRSRNLIIHSRAELGGSWPTTIRSPAFLAFSGGVNSSAGSRSRVRHLPRAGQEAEGGGVRTEGRRGGKGYRKSVRRNEPDTSLPASDIFSLPAPRHVNLPCRTARCCCLVARTIPPPTPETDKPTSVARNESLLFIGAGEALLYRR